MSQGIQQCQEFGKYAAYGFYNLGFAFIVGLGRTIIAVAHLAKHRFYHQYFESALRQERAKEEGQADNKIRQRHNASNKKNIQRKKENYQVKRNVQKETNFFDKLVASVKSGAVQTKNSIVAAVEKGKNDILDTVEEIQDDASQVKSQVKKTALKITHKSADEPWQDEVCRGLIEMIPFGSLYYTYKDWKAGRSFKSISIFGIDHFMTAFRSEQGYDALINAARR